MIIAKLIVTDLDDTLLKNDKTISDYTKAVINKIRGTGVKFAFSTARGESVRSVINSGLFDAYSLLNGALGFADGKCIFQNLIENSIYQPFLFELNKNNVKVGVEVDGCHYTNFKATEEWSNIGNNIVTSFEEVIDGSAGKIYTIAKSRDEVDLIQKLLPDDLYIKISRENLIMIMHKKATKAKAVEYLADYYGIDLDEVIAFGDDINDIDMLKTAGIGVAMENSVPEVKEIAKYICGSNEEDGLARWIEDKLL